MLTLVITCFNTLTVPFNIHLFQPLYLIAVRVQQLQTLYPHLHIIALIWLDETQALRRHAGWLRSWITQGSAPQPALQQNDTNLPAWHLKKGQNAAFLGTRFFQKHQIYVVQLLDPFLPQNTRFSCRFPLFPNSFYLQYTLRLTPIYRFPLEIIAVFHFFSLVFATSHSFDPLFADFLLKIECFSTNFTCRERGAADGGAGPAGWFWVKTLYFGQFCK